MAESDITRAYLETESTVVGVLLSLWAVIIGAMVVVGGFFGRLSGPTGAWSIILTSIPGSYVTVGAVLLALGVISFIARFKSKRHPIAGTILNASYLAAGAVFWVVAICHLIAVLGGAAGWLGFPLFSVMGTIYLLHGVALRRKQAPHDGD